MNGHNQRVAIPANLDIVEQPLAVERANGLLDTNLVNAIANIDWQVVEHRAF